LNIQTSTYTYHLFLSQYSGILSSTSDWGISIYMIVGTDVWLYIMYFKSIYEEKKVILKWYFNSIWHRFVYYIYYIYIYSSKQGHSKIPCVSWQGHKKMLFVSCYPVQLGIFTLKCCNLNNSNVCYTRIVLVEYSA
jgi:hypothetical protein